MSAKPTTKKQTSRRPSAKPVQRSCGTPGPTGKLTKEERDPLLLQAKDAFDIQSRHGRVEPGMTFDEWRRDMVKDCVGLAGISKINRSHWKSVMALFLKLSDREDEALKLELKTGVKSYRPTNENDTWESCETYVALINQKLAEHATAVVKHEKGHLGVGWFLTAARQRTTKPTLTMATLAERLDPETLCGLLSHLVSHINLREGRADHDKRKPRVYPKKADPGDFTPDPF